MKITRIIGHLIDQDVAPFKWQINRPGSGDGRSYTKSFMCLLRLQTDEGIEGQVLVVSAGY